MNLRVPNRYLVGVTFLGLYCCVMLLRAVPQRNLMGDYANERCDGILKADSNGKEISFADEEDKTQTEAINSFISSLRGGNQLQEAFKNDTFDSYPTSLIYYAIPFLVLAILSALGYFCYLMCCLCEKWCPPCECCRRDLEKKPYEGSELSCAINMAIGAAMLTLGAVILGYIKSGGLDAGLQKAECSTYMLIDELLFGSFDTTWIGFQGSITAFGDLKSLLRDTVNEIDATFSDTAWINSELQQLYQTNDKLYTDFSTQKIQASSDPSDPTAQTASNYLENQVKQNNGNEMKLGPSSSKTTSTGQIKLSLDATATVLVQLINGLTQQALLLKAAEYKIGGTIDEARKSLGDAGQQAYSLFPSLDKYFAYPEDYLAQFGQNYLIAYSVFGAAAVIVAVGGMGINCGGNMNMRYVLHAGWFLQSVLMIIGLAITSLAVPTSIALVELCGTLQDMTSSNSSMQAYSKFLPPEVLDKFGVCLFDGGDMLTHVGLTKPLTMISSMYDGIDNTINGYKKINLANSLKVIQIQIQLVGQLQDGQRTDSALTDDHNPMNSLENLNLLTNYNAVGTKQIGCQGISQDTWVFDEGTCTDTVFKISDASDYNLGLKTCIHISLFTPTRLLQRYVSIVSQCPASIYNSIKSYHTAIYGFDSKRRDLFGKLLSDLQDFKAMNANFNSQVVKFISSLSNFKQRTTPLEQLINDPKAGLITRMKCSYLKNSFTRLKYSFCTISSEGLCVSFVTPVFFVLISMMVISLTMVKSTLCAYTGVMRYARKQTHEEKSKKSEVHPAQNDEPALAVAQSGYRYKPLSRTNI